MPDDDLMDWMTGPELSEPENLSVSEFLHVINETLKYNYERVSVIGEVGSFKVNQGKWVFFDLKDETSSVSVFLPVWKLRVPLEDGMKVIVQGTPGLTKWGKFSLTAENIRPVGEGSIKKGFELLKEKLTKEGLFDPLRKREIPEGLTKIGVISSVQAAGYADFCKILNARWGGLEVYTAHTQVQGMDAPDQIIRALKYFNEQAEVEIIAIIRGGGSADDLSAFNDEKLVRAIAASRIPVITGIGHEIDESLSDLAADIMASTPSNVAEMLTPDRKAEQARIRGEVLRLSNKIVQEIEMTSEMAYGAVTEVKRGIDVKIQSFFSEIAGKRKVLEGLNPEKVLARGYAIVTGELRAGETVKIMTDKSQAEAKIIKVKERSKNG